MLEGVVNLHQNSLQIYLIRNSNNNPDSHKTTLWILLNSTQFKVVGKISNPVYLFSVNYDCLIQFQRLIIRLFTDHTNS